MFDQVSSEQLIRAGTIFAATIIALFVVKRIILFRLKALATKTSNTYDDLVIRILDTFGGPFYLIMGLFAAWRFLALPDRAGEVIQKAAIIVTAFYVVKILQAVVDYIADRLINRRDDDAGLDAPVKVLSRIIKGILWILAGVVLLDNLDFNVSSLIAGIGVGGIAIAFALQNILEDVFSYFSIYFDKPFEIGDFIAIEDKLGEVKYIGIKTTRLATLQGEELVVSNKVLTNSMLHNYKRMPRRRIQFNFGILYETPIEKVEKVQKIVRDIVKEQKEVELDRGHFKSFGDSSLDFEVVYFVKSGDYDLYMDKQHAINLEIMKAFKKEGIEFAYPTRTVFVKK